MEMERKQREVVREEKIAPVQDRDSPCLSFAQQSLWLIDQLEPGSPVCNTPYEIHLRGELDHKLLERCLNEIVQRHEVLRTSFKPRGDEVVPTIAPSLAIALPVIDLSCAPMALREERLRQHIFEGANTGFNLQHGPLLRTTLFKLASREHVLLLVVHHIVFDGASMGVFNGELEALYGAYRKGLPSPPAALFLPYAPFAVSELYRE